MPRDKRPPGMSAKEVLALYSVRNDLGCLVWTKSIKDTGYGQVSFGGRPVNVHLLAWVAEHGPVPPGMTVDHVCHNEAASRGDCAGGNACPHRPCIDLDHLTLAENGANSRASVHTQTGKHSRLTHCKHGHEFTPANTYIRPDNGARVCRTCQDRRRTR